MGIITLSGNVLHLLKAYPKKGLEEVSQPEPNTANDSSTEYKGKARMIFKWSKNPIQMRDTILQERKNGFY
ncbi:CFF_collapsed_G0018330.mRNA.1.CDS.1 [Saccharomyces cerevisiae]|nr:CFF_collapsed_G0018330.mRNA.1.CDS.1 [Saccharomyces cerevisiae]